MKLFYSCMGRLRSYPHYLWHIVKDKSNKIFWPALRGHRLVVSGRLFFTFLCFMLFSIGIVRSQSPSGETVDNSSITPLNIGDPIPDALWNLPLQVVNHPQGKQTITLNDYRGKLIILDFWATWCAPCLKSMPKLHELSKAEQGELVPIPVSMEKKETIAHSIDKRTDLFGDSFFSVFGDSVLRSYFQHKIIPHYVWIRNDGTYIAATDDNALTQKNIALIPDGQTPPDVIKKDLNPDRPLFLTENVPASSVIAYSILKKGKYIGYGAIKNLRKVNDNVVGIALANISLLDIYQNLFSLIAVPTEEGYHFKKLIINGKTYKDFKKIDSLAPVQLRAFSEPDLTDTLYSYDFKRTDQVNPRTILDDFNRSVNYIGKIEVREIECLDLIAINGTENLKSNGGKPTNTLFYGKRPSLINLKISSLIKRLNGLNNIPYYIFDRTNVSSPIDITFEEEPSYASIVKTLKAHGLQLVPSKRKTEVFVIDEKTILGQQTDSYKPNRETQS